MTKKRGFTLVEILVVVSIIALVAGLTIPAIKAMQAGSARAEAYNTINAALQGVRSYAIMNNVKAAARFQPNGKVVFVYRCDNLGPAQAFGGGAATWGSTYIYLPVLDQEPLKMPNGYAASKIAEKPTLTTSTTGLAPVFFDPFYVCYNPDGTIAIKEPIRVALTDDTDRPVNPNFDKDTGPAPYAWNAGFPSSYDLEEWLKFTQGKTEAASIGSINDRKLARYYYVAGSEADLEDIFENQEIGIDHFAGRTFNIIVTVSVTGGGTQNQTYTSTMDTQSISQFAIFKTPENWSKWPLFVNDSNVTQTKTKYVQDELTTVGKAGGFVVNPDLYETIFINPYTGRLIRANQ